MAPLALATPARADDSFVAKTQIYTDSDHTTVVSPLAALSRDAWNGGTLSASYVADVVSSASIDVISNATSHMHDFRSEITAGLVQKLRNSTLSASYVYSVENDYQSHNVELGFAQDMFEKNSTLAFGATFSGNDVYRTGDQSFHRRLNVGGASASWTQVLDRATIAQLSYSFSYGNGYWASPYRFVKIETPDFQQIEFKVPETEPNERYRHAAVIGLNRHLFTDTSLQGDYRFYTDNWGILSHTVQLRYFVTWKDVTLRLRERFYYQIGRQLLPAALHGGDAAAVRDRRSRAVDVLVERRRLQSLVATALGASRARARGQGRLLPLRLRELRAARVARRRRYRGGAQCHLLIDALRCSSSSVGRRAPAPLPRR